MPASRKSESTVLVVWLLSSSALSTISIWMREGGTPASRSTPSRWSAKPASRSWSGETLKAIQRRSVFAAKRAASESTQSPSRPVMPRSSAMETKCAGDSGAVHRVVPADQRLDADDRPAICRIDRLVHQPHVAARIQRSAQVALDHALACDQIVHVAGEDRMPTAAVLLGFVERDVGLAQQVCRIGVGAARDGDADGGADMDLVAHQAEGLAELAEQALAEFLGGAEALDVEDDDGEFVAAQSRDGVDLADRVFEARGSLADQLVAAGMAERVVDRLEAIEVDIEQADLAVVARDGKQRAAQPILEQSAVGQAGQRVVEGEELCLALALLQRTGGRGGASSRGTRARRRQAGRSR